MWHVHMTHHVLYNDILAIRYFVITLKFIFAVVYLFVCLRYKLLEI